MKSFYHSKELKSAILDSVYFWLFWMLITGIFLGILEGTVSGALKSIVGIILPHIVPVFLIGVCFDILLMKKKIFLFLLIAIPFGYGAGRLINFWFHWILQGTNVVITNEILIFLFALTYIGFRYTKVAIAQRILLKDAENQRVLAELHHLRSQLNPHFLFNSLNSIYSLILSKSDKSAEAVLTLSELMRSHLDLSNEQLVDLSQEIYLLERYIFLEELRLDETCKVNFCIHGNPNSVRIAPLIFMPFVENAFKHGITSQREANFVNIEVSINNKTVELHIINSVAAKRRNTMERGNKIGITNTLKRLELHYAGKYTYLCTESENTYAVKLTLNAHE